MTSPGGSSIAQVIDKGFCIGCGACSAIDPRFRLGMNGGGFLGVQARPSEPAVLARASAV